MVEQAMKIVMNLYNSILFIILFTIQICNSYHLLSVSLQFPNSQNHLNNFRMFQIGAYHGKVGWEDIRGKQLFLIQNMPTLTQQFIQKAILNLAQDQKCEQLHPGVSCNMKMLLQFMATCKSLYKMYLLVHLIPFILFKRKKLRNRPAHEIGKLVIAFVKSMLFAGGYTLIVRRTICFLTQHYKFSSSTGVVGAMLGGLTLFFEPAGRQSEISLYCVNKTIQTLYHMGIRRNYPIKVPYGECLLVGVAIAVICFHYVDCPSAIISNYQRVLEKVLGNV